MANTERDPVCGMELDARDEQLTATYDGKEYRFCSENCRKQFVQYPTDYVGQHPFVQGE